MYKILIVDDEEFVRTAITNVLDWKELGFSEVLEAEDGELAYEIAMEHRPDVILTDIRMPFMDGLELAGKITNELPHTKILLLTGHDEFEYAKKALEIGITEYILKPVRAQALTEILQRTRAALDRARESRRMQTMIKRQLRQSLPLLKEKFFNALVRGKLSEAEIQKRLQYLEINLAAEGYAVCVLEPDAAAEAATVEDHEIDNITIQNFISEITAGNGESFMDYTGRHVLIWFVREPAEENRAGLHAAIAAIRETVEARLKKALTVGMGATAASLADIRRSYNDALHALEYKVLYGKNQVYDIEDLGYRRLAVYFPMDRIAELLCALRLCGEWEALLNNLFSEMAAQRDFSPENLKMILNEMVNGGQKLLLESLGKEAQGILDFDIYSKTAKLETLAEAREFMHAFLKDISNKLAVDSHSKRKLLIEKAKQYLADNYHDPKLSLNTVAKALFVSAPYLSMLFKKETGDSFVDYLTRLRMEKARYLLRTQALKTYETAERVGYSDPHYFSVSFKKYTGVTPSEYRNNP